MSDAAPTTTAATATTDTAARPRFVLMTQDNCAGCDRLKLMLDKPLKGEFADRIEPVHRTQHPERFAALADAHHVRSTPALIDTERGEVLSNTTSLMDVKKFLQR